MSDPPLVLDTEMRAVVDDAIRRHCDFRRWPLVAMNVRTNHVHCVVGWKGEPPERVMTELKTWSTRALKSIESLGRRTKFWTVHGSTRYLWNDRSVHDASRYVLFGQDRAQIPPARAGGSD
jgi:REP element-mobilizing transposase RayT